MGDPNWGGGLKGAAGGAMSGAGMGSMIMPGVGTAVGAGIGGLAGLFGGLFGDNGKDQVQDLLQNYYNSVHNRQAPQANYSDFRDNQKDLVNRLTALSEGKGPSLAAQQYQQAMDRSMSQQQSMANSGRGGPMSQLTAANNMGMLGAQGAQGSAIARTGEELGALGQLGGVINEGRGADENVNINNMLAKLKQMGMDDSAAMAAIQGMMGNNAQPSQGDQLLAGGAGAMGLAFGQGKGGLGANDPSKYWQGSQRQGSLYGLGMIGPQPQAPGPTGFSYDQFIKNNGVGK
jgi:hypothetical protein